jgi:hypothetical protein
MVHLKAVKCTVPTELNKNEGILRRIEIRRYNIGRPYGTLNPLQRLIRTNCMCLYLKICIDKRRKKI